ncbi:MAG: sel1 repeat family protein [Clostridia bacterium]|nr:sel1 repeat family protein [Clostridia bacterium]
MKEAEKKSEITKEEFAQLLAKAKAGDVDAEWEVAGCYRTGDGVERSEKSAYNWYKKAAEQGSAKAQNALGACFECGSGIKKDEAKALYWYEQARDNGSAAAWCNLGLCYLHRVGMIYPDPAKAFQYFDVAVKKGYGRALIVLAKCYLEGEGCDRDVKKARKYIKQAAKDPKLVQELADEGRKLFDRGGWSFAKPNDFANALELTLPAAKAGNGKAYYTLFLAYSKGRGVSKDIKKEIKYFQLSQKAGYKEPTANKLNAMTTSMWEYLDVEHAKAKAWFDAMYPNFNKATPTPVATPTSAPVTASEPAPKPYVDPDADTLYHVQTKVSVRYYNEHEGSFGLKVYDADADATFYYESKSGRTATRSTSVRFSNVQYNSVSVSDVEYRCSSYTGKY